MLYNALNGTVAVGNTLMDYISFGKGTQNLVILPGLGDGLTTVKGTALPFAVAYRIYAADFRVYVFSRKRLLEKGCSTRDMAKDQAEAMKTLGIANADVMGVSQGGMIAQYLAIDHPALVHKLVLTVTLSKQNTTVQNAVGKWLEMAKKGDYKGIMIDTAENSYSDRYLRKYRFLYPFLGLAGRSGDLSRFILQAESCLRHDAYGELDKIQCPSLIIGGCRDRIAGADSSAEIAGKVKDSELYLYQAFGHAAYEEAKDYHARVIHFLESN